MMSDNPTVQPPSYNDVIKASAPPAESYGPGQPPYPTSQQPSYPIPQQAPYPVSYPPQPGVYNYGAGVAQPYPPPQQYPPASGQPLQPGYGAPPVQVHAFSQPGPMNAQGYAYNTVTVVGTNTAPGYASGYQPVMTTQVIAQQTQRKKMMIGIFIFVLCVIFFIILVGIIL